MGEALVPEIQLTKKFYIDQLGLLLKNSITLPQQMDLYVIILNELNDVSADLLNDLDVLQAETPNSDILTKIGKIVAGPREFLYDGKSYVMNDKQYLAYIYAHIIQNNWDGTLKEANELYTKLCELDSNIEIKIQSTETPLEVYLIMNQEALPEDEEEKTCYQAMFNSGYFDLVSMGISFHRIIQNFTYTGYWDGVNEEVIKAIYGDQEEVDGISKEEFVQNHGYWDKMYWN